MYDNYGFEKRYRNDQVITYWKAGKEAKNHTGSLEKDGSSLWRGKQVATSIMNPTVWCAIHDGIAPGDIDAGNCGRD